MHTWKAGVAALAGVLCLSAPGVRAQDADLDLGLEGTWLVQISLADCTTGATLGAPFLSLLSFARGGTMTETTSNPSFYPAERGPGHGVWQRAAGGDHTYDALSVAFITLNGTLVRIQSIAQTIQLQGGDTFKTTSAAVKFTRPDGTLLGGGCAAATGTRLEIAAD